MVNHLYSLLMNVNGQVPPDTNTIGIELIAPEYRKIELPSFLDAVRATLFGTDPDRNMLSYRCRQLVTVLHGTALESFVTDLDPRLTYKFADAGLANEQLFRPISRRVSGEPDDQLNVSGIPESPDATGRTTHVYLVETLTSTTVRVSRQTSPISNPVLTFTVNELFPLAGSGYSGKLRTDTIGQRHLIEVVNRPTRGLGELVDMASRLGEPVIAALFGTTQAEPYKSLRSLWATAEVPLRLGALTVATAYRTEEARHK